MALCLLWSFEDVEVQSVSTECLSHCELTSPREYSLSSRPQVPYCVVFNTGEIGS